MAQATWRRSRRMAVAAMCLSALAALAVMPAAAQQKLPPDIPRADGMIQTQYTMRYIEVEAGTGKPASSESSPTATWRDWRR